MKSAEVVLGDEKLSRELQGLQVSDKKNNDKMTSDDERLAMELALNEARATGSKFALQTGQSAIVRLHHPLTKMQIGEEVLARYISTDEMAFEQTGGQGKYLKARESGIVEFSVGRDSNATFKISNSSTGSLYLMPLLFSSSLNKKGSKGWYLSMTNTGQLYANGGKDKNAEWILVSSSPAQQLNMQKALQQSRNAVSSQDIIENPILLSAGSNLATPAPLSAPSPSPSSVPASSLVSSTLPTAPAYSSNASSNQLGNVDRNNATNNNTHTNNFAYSSTPLSFPGFGAGRTALVKYLQTPAGVQFLKQPEYKDAYELHLNNSSLAKILHRPDWPVVARRFKDFSQPAVQNAQVDQIVAEKAAPAAVVKQFFEQGFTVLTSTATDNQIQEALKVINFWVFRGLNFPPVSSFLVKNAFGRVELLGDITQDMDVLSLYYDTTLPHVMQRLMGSGEVQHPKMAGIEVYFPNLELTVISPALFGDRWVVDGFDSRGGHSPYNVLIGVALTDIDDIDMGNICVHPGSHLLLMEQYCDCVQRGSTLFSDDPYLSEKPDLGSPQQIKLRAGDSFLCTQRLARLNSLNTSHTPTIIVYFKVSHVDHAVLKEPALQSLWLEFPLASTYLEATAEGSQQSDGSNKPEPAGHPSLLTEADQQQDSLLVPANQNVNEYESQNEPAVHSEHVTAVIHYSGDSISTQDHSEIIAISVSEQINADVPVAIAEPVMERDYHTSSHHS